MSKIKQIIRIGSVKVQFAELKKSLRRNWSLYLLLLVPVTYIILFAYVPMYGAQIAFKDYQLTDSITGSRWIGFENFRNFFTNYMFWNLIRNTLSISLYSLLTFPIPIIFALLLQYLPFRKYGKVVQMVTYAPHFISNVVMCSMVLEFLAVRGGLVNILLEKLGVGTVDFMGEPRYFYSVYVWSGVWQSMGYSSIIYISALTSIDPTLHEAATIDGANLIKRIWHIDIPGIMPMVTIMLVLRCGQLLNIGYEKVLLLQNKLNYSTSEVIQTYVWKMGITSQIPQYAYSSAVGLFTSVINFAMLISVNAITKKMNGSSLW